MEGHSVMATSAKSDYMLVYHGGSVPREDGPMRGVTLKRAKAWATIQSFHHDNLVDLKRWAWSAAGSKDIGRWKNGVQIS
jgi:hypothetical protein